MNTPYAKLAATVLGLACAGAHAATIAVTTTADEFGTGIGCSLREAVQSANGNADVGGCAHGGSYGNDTISVPQGFYALTRGDFGSFADIDEDNNSVVDLDIKGNLVIQGAGSSIVSIGNLSGNYRGRIVHVVSGAVTIAGVTLRDGNNPTGRFGGALRSNPGTSVTLNAVRVVGNSADGGAGGILNEGVMTLNDCLVDGNRTTHAFLGGGGLYSAAGTLTLNDSRVLDNRTEGNGANGSGAGIYNEADSSLFLDNTTVDGNEIAIGGTTGADVEGNGGGIYTLGPTTIVQSTISNNIAAGNQSRGGGIYRDHSGASLIELSLISGNRADTNPDVSQDATGSGGLYSLGTGMIVRDSIIANNVSSRGAGGGAFARNTTFERCLFANNRAEGSLADGGGLEAATGVVIVDSTFIGNQSDEKGGGINVSTGTSDGIVRMFSSTVAGNTSHLSIGFGEGGGVSVEVGEFYMANSVLAGNVESGSGNHDDCDGTILSLGHNRIGIVSGCTITGAGSTDTFGDPKLAAAANNGGPTVGATNGAMAGMLTHAPLPDSPLLDRGDPTGCHDHTGAIIALDGVGNDRAVDGPDPNSTATCDIGAIELPGDPVFADGFE